MVYIRNTQVFLKVKEREEVMIENERRKYPRYSEEISVKMFVHDPNKPSRIANFTARTLDVSRGGFRIESPRELATGSIVGFVLDNEVATHVMSKIGEVKWCRPVDRSEYFEFGMAVYP